MPSTSSGASVKIGSLDRRIAILRNGPATDDGYTIVPGELGILAERSARWQPASRLEQFESMGKEAKSGGSFVIRSDNITRQIVETDKLTYHGALYEIQGIRELGRRDAIELFVEAPDGQTEIDLGGLSPVPDAPDGNAEFIRVSRIAESNISGHRILAASLDGRVSHVGKDDADASNVFGVSEGASLVGGSVSIITLGEMQEISWNWSAGPVWLGDDGLMTQTVPTSGLLVQIGVATEPTKLNVNPQVIVQL